MGQQDHAAAIGARLAWLLQGFGVVMVAICALLLWDDKGNGLLDALATLSLERDEQITPILLAAATVALLCGQIVAHVYQTVAEPYATGSGQEATIAFRRFVVDALCFALIAGLAVSAAGGPARSRVIVGGLVLWHVALLIGQAMRTESGRVPGRAMLSHSVAAVAYLLVLALLTLAGRGARNEWWSGMVVLLLAFALSLPTLWRTVPAPAASGPGGDAPAR